MPYCPNCGVEIDKDATGCPLCGEPRRPPCADEGPRPQAPSGTADSEGRGFLRWEIASVSAFIAAIVVGGADLLTSGRFGWSLFVLASLGACWIVATAAFVLRGLPRIALFALTPPALLGAINLVVGGRPWALEIGLPIAVAAELSVAAVALVAARTRRKGLNLPAYALMGAAATSIVCECGIDLFATGSIALAWSTVVACATVPVSAFLLYLHFRVFGDVRVKRFIRL